MALYEFIYGSRRHEFFDLIKGLDGMIQESRTVGKKFYLTVALKDLAIKAWRKAVGDRARLFRKWAGESVDTVVKKAEAGDEECLFKLIAFDKTRLADSFVQKRIAQAQARRDTRFFKRLGEAVKRTTGLLEGTRGRADEKQENMRSLICLLRIAGFDFEKADAAKIMDLVDGMRNELEEEWLPVPSTSGVIKTTLRRMGIPIGS